MSAEPVLHNLAISQVMVNFAAQRGVDAETCLLGTDISEALLQDSEALIPREQEMRLVENLMLALPDVPALGFELGMQYNISTFGIWGFALRTSRNLQEAAERALRYLPLSTAYCKFTLIQTGDEYGVSADPGDIPPHLRQFLLERDMATGINLFRELTLVGLTLKRLEFAGPVLPYADRIHELAGVEPVFNQTRNAVVVNLDAATTPLPMYDEHLVRMMEDQCRQLLQRRQVMGIAGQVRQKLLGSLGLVATLEEVAKELNMAPRSLRRKLEEEGASFRSLVEETRQHLATQLLESTNMKLDELALQLGYADTASFTRAFRRWFKLSPGEYRKANHE